MAEATTDAAKPGPRKRGSRWWRIVAWCVGILAALVVTLYFVVTSSRFLQVQILPRVSEALHAKVTVSSGEIHPFSEIVLHDLKVQPTNQPPVLTARLVRLRYHLWDIIGGKIRVDEADVDSPVFQVVENPDGSSNLKALLASQKKAGGGKAAAGKAAKPLKLDIRKVTISNAGYLLIQNHDVGSRDLVELTNVSFAVTGVRNGGEGKVTFAATLRDEYNPPAPAMYGLLEARVDGAFDFALTGDLKLGPVLGDARLEIAQAAGAFSDFAKLNGMLHCDFSPSQVKLVSLNFEKGGVPLGELRATGPYDAEKSQGRLEVELLSVDKQVLNLLGAKVGVDFGSTTITLTNQIEMAKGGAAIAVMGQLNASQFQLSRTNVSTPAIDLRADYNVALDKAEKTAVLRELNVTGTEKKRPLLRAELTSPMTLAWGNQTNAVGDSAFTFAVTKLNLADWQPLVGSVASAGTLDLNLKLHSQEGGRRLTFDATNRIENLSTEAGGQRLTDISLAFKTHGLATNFQRFDLSDFDFQIGRSNHTALAISGSGTYDVTNAGADLRMTVRGVIPRVLELAGVGGVTATAGAMQLTARVTQAKDKQTVAGDLAVTNFTGKIGANEFRNFNLAMGLDVAKTAEEIQIHKAAGALAQGRNPGGNFELSGTYSLVRKPSQFTVKLSGFNEDGLRPFVEPLLGARKLVSVAVDGTAFAEREPNGDSAVRADLQVTNLLVSDPAAQLPATPLSAKLQVDAGIAKKVADVRKLDIALTPTQRAKNEFQLRGRVDASNTNAIQGNLTLTADALDVTSYYNLFSTTNGAAAKANVQKTGAEAKTSGAGASATPGVVTNELPFKNFTVDASVGQFYLREIAATNFHATVKLDRARVQLQPFQLTLNGSPICATADVDLSVPGYKYALSFDATNVPFGPLWNTFKPQEKGKVHGTLTALTDIKGIGTTGEAMQKNLSGKFDVGTTNLNLAVDNVRNPVLKTLVFVIAKMPELLKNPAGAGASVATGALDSLFGNQLSGDLAKDLKQSPIDVIAARGTIGSGKVQLEKGTVRSPAFLAESTGTITLAKELTNSTIQLPISISLARPLAEEIHFVPNNTPTNAAYVKFPDFYSETGTLAKPTPHINALALGADALRGLGFNIPTLTGTNGVIGNVLQGFGGFLQGGNNTNAAPGTNQAPATTNQPPATKQSPVNNLLNHLLGQ